MDSETLTNPTIKKFYPTAEECKINNLVKCTEDGCSNEYTSESNLILHLKKTHKKSHLLESNSCSKEYYCPELGCIYNKNKFFKNMKSLRQHYIKVHTEKKFQCTLCQKHFPTKNYLNNHIEYCGINFECCDCQACYPCYETLKTHGRRKKHSILLKQQYKSQVVISKSEDIVTFNKNKFILPKQCISLIMWPNASKPTMNREIQTENEKPKLRCKMTQVNKISQNNQQTQTGKKHSFFTVETQTVGDSFNINNKYLDHALETSDQKTSITQTDIVESRNTSCNTSFNLEDFEFSIKTEKEKNSSGTQTSHAQCTSNIYSASTATHDSIHTDTSDLLNETLNENMSNFEFFNCNMETQTDFMLDDEMFDCDYYMSNMHTQTCDEILNDLGFSDIQTQTVLDDVLRSVESQTMVSHGRKYIVCKDINHMQTQTDMEYMNMLEVINS